MATVITCCKAHRLSSKRLLPALHGGHSREDGHLKELLARDKHHTRHDIQVATSSFVYCTSQLQACSLTWLSEDPIICQVRSGGPWSRSNSYICRSWLANDEEIMLDMATCAMAFRLLRLHRYDVSSGKWARVSCFWFPLKVSSHPDRNRQTESKVSCRCVVPIQQRVQLPQLDPGPSQRHRGLAAAAESLAHPDHGGWAGPGEHRLLVVRAPQGAAVFRQDIKNCRPRRGRIRAQISLPLQHGPAGAQVEHRTLQEAGLPDAEVAVPVR